MSAMKLPFIDPGKIRKPVQARPDDKGGSVLSVSVLIARIKGALTDAFPATLRVAGEISNLKIHGSGHVYFRLKDAAAAIDATMFRSSASRLKFRPADGMAVVVTARVDVYDVRGQLQLYIEDMVPQGAGALELAFRQLMEKLQKEGLFDAAAKKPISRFPRGIGIVTSPTGAAIRDISRTLSRRWPAARVYLVPALVQGEGAAETIVDALCLLDENAERLEIDTIILARGGGSLEDIWPFNEEILAHAIFAAKTPIISGVGHEVDVTICDLVADVRAATPTAAAEIAVPDARDVFHHLHQLSRRLGSLVKENVKSARAVFTGILRSIAFRDPLWRLRTQNKHIDELSHRLLSGARGTVSLGRKAIDLPASRLAMLHPARLMERAKGRLAAATSRLAWVLGGRSKRCADVLASANARLAALHPMQRLKFARQQLDAAQRQLGSLSYRSVLNRGYSITRTKGGKILRSPADVQTNELITTQLQEGQIDSRVVDGGKAAQKAKSKSADNSPTLFEFTE